LKVEFFIFIDIDMSMLVSIFFATVLTVLDDNLTGGSGGFCFIGLDVKEEGV